MIPKSEIILADTYRSYVESVKEDSIGKALTTNTRQFRKLVEDIPRRKVDYAYAEGKWTIREMMQHIIDSERVFAYRALRLSRMDLTPLAAFDEQQWAAHAGGAARRWKDLKEEFHAVRDSTEYLFDSLTDEQLRFVGEARGLPLNAFTIGFIIPGHTIHHMSILRERYL